MQTLNSYLDALNSVTASERQTAWYRQLDSGVKQGQQILGSATPEEISNFSHLFWNWVRTEEIKAWYGEPENDSLFQGTSVTALTIPGEYKDPLAIDSINILENTIADAYIEQHDQHEPIVRKAILENVDHWMSEGVFYGIAIASKVISQAFGLVIPADDVVFDVAGVSVDPHQITTFPKDIRKAYFETCLKRLNCFDGLDLDVRELESALVLADISKPNITEYKNRLMLAPVRCNEICSLISQNVTQLICEKTKGRIQPRSLMVTIFDTDTPYTYHQINGYYGNPVAPVLPGITVLGTSGTIEAFRWLYAYRVGLVAQKMMKSSLYSEVGRSFIPFAFFGVLVERDAEILLDLDNLDTLRYRGQLSPYLEFSYMIPKLENYLNATSDRRLADELQNLLY